MAAIASLADLRAGQPIPALEVAISREDLVKYAGAADDYTYVHWDHPRMTAEGFADVVVHGWLTFAHMCRAVTNWIPPELAAVQAYAVRYRRPTFPGKVACGGEVVEVCEGPQGPLVKLSLWARDADGEVTTTATMTLAGG